MVVSRDSATGSASSEKFHDQIAIQANHSEMVKFNSPDNGDYRAVARRIGDLVRDAPKILRKQFGKHGRNQKGSSM